jgi:aminoglycoside phosphotransferase (APT) family kinase protein
MIAIDEPLGDSTGEQLDLSLLTGFLCHSLNASVRVASIRRFPGGYSNLTYLLVLADGQELVLRCPPPGAKEIKGGHDVLREYSLLCTLRDAGFSKIPMPVAACPDEGLLGFPFYVMQRVKGVILRGNHAALNSISSAQMRLLSETTVDQLALLHSLDLIDSGLIRLGRPEAYVRRQVDGWHKRYLAAQTEDILAMDTVYTYLDREMPTENAPALLHNDFKFDNFILNPDSFGDILAILDWEMSSVGDPLMDVGTTLAYWVEAGDSDFEKQFNLSWLPGCLTRQEFAARYAEKSGRDISRLSYYMVFGLFKNAVIMQQIYARWKKGLTKDERFAGLILGVKLMAKKAERLLEK